MSRFFAFWGYFTLHYSHFISPWKQYALNIENGFQRAQKFSSSFLSAGSVANAMDALQPSRLCTHPIPPPACLDVPMFAARCLHVHDNARDPSSER